MKHAEYKAAHRKSRWCYAQWMEYVPHIGPSAWANLHGVIRLIKGSLDIQKRTTAEIRIGSPSRLGERALEMVSSRPLVNDRPPSGTSHA